MKVSYLVLARNTGRQMIGFSGRGDWTIYKCFYENEGKYGEFYINMNPKRGVMEIVGKDKDYAFDLIQAFGNSMLGKTNKPARTRRERA
jgi:hypothetical protein